MNTRTCPKCDSENTGAIVLDHYFTHTDDEYEYSIIEAQCWCDACGHEWQASEPTAYPFSAMED